LSRSIDEEDVVLNPLNKMVFKDPLDYLVQQVRRQELMHVSMWKAICEWLRAQCKHFYIQFEVRHTMIPSMIPYSSHSSFFSSASYRASVSLWLRRPPPASRSFHLAVHLVDTVSNDMKTIGKISPPTPILNYTPKKALFRIVCDIRSQPIDCSPIVAVSIPDNFSFFHARVE
jgi:hypothetical protein